jgi:hypothetical protein
MSSKKKVVVKTKPVQKPVQKPTVEKKAKSKMDLCDEWMTDNPGKPRKEVIQVMQDKFGLTKAGASTYFAILKKRLNYKNK